MDEVGEITVRPAQLEDVEALADIHVAGYQLAHRGLAPDETLAVRTPELRRRVWRERLSVQPAARESIIVAEAGGEIAGFASLRPAQPAEAEDGERTAFWENLYLDPRYIGSPVALALFQAAVPRLREQGFTEVVAFVAAGNERIERFVQRQGFHFDGGSRESEGVRERRIRRALS